MYCIYSIKRPGFRNSSTWGKGHTPWNKGLTGLKGHKTNNGKHWYNNGEISTFAYECPEGFVPGRI